MAALIVVAHVVMDVYLYVVMDVVLYVPIHVRLVAAGLVLRLVLVIAAKYVGVI